MNTDVLLQELSWPVAPKQTRLATPRGKSKTIFGNKNAELGKILSHSKKSLTFIARTSKTKQGIGAGTNYIFLRLSFRGSI